MMLEIAYSNQHTLAQERDIELGGEEGGMRFAEEEEEKKKATNLSRDYVISKLREILRGIGDGESRRKIVQGSGYVGS